MLRSLAFLLVASAALVAVPGAASATHNVQVGGAPPNAFSFSPANISINPGDSVHWTWASNTHTVTSGDLDTCTPDNAFDSGIQNTGATFDRTFNQSGVIEYFCTVHCAGAGTMVGTITVGNPTAIRVKQLTVGSGRAGAVVRWRTASEADVLGFHVYRQRGATRVRLNGALIPAYGTAKGHAYSFVARGVTSGRFFLRVVGTDGRPSWLGPAVLSA